MSAAVKLPCCLMLMSRLRPTTSFCAAHAAASSQGTAASALQCRLCALSLYIASLERPNGTLASPFAGQLPSLLPLALNLLPTCLIPGIAAGMAANVMPSRPAALGLSSGVLVALGAASTLQLLLLSGQGVLWTLVLVPAGWIAGQAIWQQLGAVIAGVAGGDSHKKHEEQVDAEKGAAAEQWRRQQQQQLEQPDGPLNNVVHATSYAVSHLHAAVNQLDGSPLALPVALHMQAGGRSSMGRLAVMGLIAVLVNAVPHGMVLARAAVVQADEPSHLLLPSLIVGTLWQCRELQGTLCCMVVQCIVSTVNPHVACCTGIACYSDCMHNWHPF